MTIDNDVQVGGAAAAGMATVTAAPVAASLAARLWTARAADGSGVSESVGDANAEPVGRRSGPARSDPARLLGDLEVALAAGDIPAMRRDLGEEDELVRNMLERLA